MTASTPLAPPPARTVRAVMQQQVVTLVPEMTVRELIHTLLENDISGAPVLDPNGKVIGVASMTDVLRLAAHEAEIPAGQVGWDPSLPARAALDEDAEDADAGSARVSFSAPGSGAVVESSFDDYEVRDIMTPVAFAVAPGDSIADASRLLRHGRIHRALVMENGSLLGIVTPFDLLAALEADAEARPPRAVPAALA